MSKKSVKEIVIAILHDAGICILGGVVFTAIISVIISLIAGIVSGFDVYTILNALRSGLLIVGAIGLFVLSGIMIGQKSNAKIRSSKKWNEVFRVLGPTFVLLIISVTILAIATIVDYVVWIS